MRSLCLNFATKMYLFFVIIFLINCGQVFNYGTIAAPPLIDPTQDARTILNAPNRPPVLVQIFPHRYFYQRQQINDTFTQLNSGGPLSLGNYFPLSNGNPFQDVLYAMIAGPQKTFTSYMHSSLTVVQDPTTYGPVLIEILVYSDIERQYLTEAYDENPNYGGSFANTVARLDESDYKNFLKELIIRTREPEPHSVNSTDVDLTVQGLSMEYSGWNNNRPLLDYVLINKSKKYVQQVIQKFPAANNGMSLVQVVHQNIQDMNLRFGYSSLIYYILDPVDWIAARIHDSQNEPDQRATQIIFIVSLSECCLYEINQKFKTKYQMTIGQYLRAQNSNDTVDQMLISIADDGIAGQI